MRLGAKLAWLSAGLTALFIAATFIPLTVTSRSAMIRVVTDELHQTQHVLLESQTRELDRLEYAARVLGENSNLKAALATDPSSSRAGANPRLDPRLVHTAERALGDALPNVNKDLIVVTDERGRVFATASRRPGVIANGTDLSAMPAVRLALDPSMPADTGAYGVLHLTSGDFSVAAVPLTIDGRTLGAMLLGQRIDSAFVGATRAAFRGDVVVTAGDEIIEVTRRDLAPGDVRRLVAAAAGNEADPTILVGGEEMVGAPLSLGKNQAGAPVTVWLLQPVGRLTGAVTRPMTRLFLIYGLIAIVLSALGAALVSQTVLRPFYRFVTYLRGVKPSAEAPPRFDAASASPEIQELDESFAALMLALRESEEQLRQSQKLEAIGTLAGGVAHDFNNLLTVITGYTQLALRRMPAEDPLRNDLKQVIEASNRAANLIHQLLAFGRKQVFLKSVIDLDTVVDGIVPMLRRLIAETIELRVEADARLARIIADRGQLEQVIINLVINARDAMPRGGVITIRTANEGEGAERRVMLSVSDNGSGIAPEIVRRIFEPFFTTKEVGKGTGLGLSTVYGIVKQSGGDIEIDTVMGQGTTFTVLLPRGGDVADAAPLDAAEMPMPRGTETILVVEDEAEVRALAGRTLEGLGYTVIASGDSAEAVRLGTASKIDLVLSDIVMPVMSGPKVVASLAERGVRPIVVYMSGYPDDALDEHGLDSGSPFLRKPFHPAELAQTIRAAIDRGRNGNGTVAPVPDPSLRSG